MTATVRVAAVEAARVQVPVFVVRLIVTTLSSFVSTPVPLQSVANNPVPVGVLRVIAGAALEVVKPDGNVTVMELPAAREPVDEVVNPIVHVEAVFSTNDVGAVPVKLSVESDVAPAPETVVSSVRNNTASATAMAAQSFGRTGRESL
jgi:hypothetical protein